MQDLRAGQALLRAFKKAEYLVELALSADEVGEALWEDFRREFASKRSSIHPVFIPGDSQNDMATSAAFLSLLAWFHFQGL